MQFRQIYIRFRQKKTYKGQVVLLEALPQDRESVFWFTVKSVQPKTDKPQNSIELSIAQRIKLFYRPKDIDDNCAIAVKKLEWKLTEKGVRVTNPSQVSVSVVELKQGKFSQKINDVVMPLSSKEWKVSGINGNVDIVFGYVDEYGNYLYEPGTLK